MSAGGQSGGRCQAGAVSPWAASKQAAGVRTAQPAAVMGGLMGRGAACSSALSGERERGGAGVAGSGGEWPVAGKGRYNISAECCLPGTRGYSVGE